MKMSAHVTIATHVTYYQVMLLSSPMAWNLNVLWAGKLGMLETVNALQDIPVQLNQKREEGRRDGGWV